MKTNRENFGLWAQLWSNICNQTNILACWKPIKTPNFSQSVPKKQKSGSGSLDDYLCQFLFTILNFYGFQFKIVNHINFPSVSAC
jgi:hypothetical protein